MRLIIEHDGKRQRFPVPDGSSVQDILGILLERFQVTSNADSFRLLTSDKVELHPADIVSDVCDNDEVICLSAMPVAKPASTKQPTRSAVKGSAQKVLRDPRLEMMRAATKPVTKPVEKVMKGRPEAPQRSIFSFGFSSSKQRQLQILDESAFMYTTPTVWHQSAYDILGVSEDATEREILLAYRARALSAHPDKGGSSEAFVTLRHAYETLVSPLLRRSHDAAGPKRKRESTESGNDTSGYVIDAETQTEVKDLKAMWDVRRKVSVGASSSSSSSSSPGRTIVSIYFKIKIAILAKRIGKKPAARLVSADTGDFESLLSMVKNAVASLDSDEFGDYLPRSGVLADMEIPDERRSRGKLTLHRGVRCKHENLEVKVAEWIVQKRSEGKRISRLVVLRSFLILDDSFLGGKNDPTFMTRACAFYYRFLKRRHLSIRKVTSVGQKLPPGWEEKWEQYKRNVLAVRRLPGGGLISPDQIYNMDQTPLCIDEVGQTTVNSTGEKNAAVVTSGKEKERVTVELCVTAGGRKLLPNAIFKGTENPARLDKRVIAFQIKPENRAAFGYPAASEISLMVNPKGYANERTVDQWVNGIFKHRNGPSSTQSQDSVMIFDDFKGHKGERVRQSIELRRGRRLLIAGGLTPKAQILDRVPNRMFKQRFRHRWDMHMLDMEPGPNGKLPIPNRGLVAQWILSAWDEVTSDVIIRCAVSTGTTRAEDYDPETRERLGLRSLNASTTTAEIVHDAELAEVIDEMSDDEIGVTEEDMEELGDDDDDDGEDE